MEQQRPSFAPEKPAFNTLSISEQLTKFDQAIDNIQTPEDIEEIALEILDEDEQAKMLLEDIQKSRNKGEEDTFAIRKRAKIYQRIKLELSIVTGIPIDENLENQQKHEYKRKLQEVLQSINEEDDNITVLEKLGVISKVEGPRGYIFSFTPEKFPPYLVEQWDAYIQLVAQFEDAVKKLKSGVITQVDFSAIDLARTKAHDTISTSLAELLELPGWEHENYRRLVAKMRDKKFAQPKGEIEGYADDIRNLINKIRMHSIKN